MEPMNLKWAHALFDNRSRFSRLVAARPRLEVVEEFFGGLKARKKREGPTFRLAAASPGEAVLCLRAKSPLEAVEGISILVSQGDTLVDGKFMVIVEGLAEGTRVQAYIVTRWALEAIRKAVRFISSDDHEALRQLFQHELLETSFELRRILSAMPSLEGEARAIPVPVGEPKKIKCRLEARVPAKSPNLAKDTFLVVVLDDPEQ